MYVLMHLAGRLRHGICVHQLTALAGSLQWPDLCRWLVCEQSYEVTYIGTRLVARACTPVVYTGHCTELAS